MLCFSGLMAQKMDGPPPVEAKAIVLRSIFLVGNRRTKDYIVQREYAFERGKSYSEDELEKQIKLTSQQLINTSLFVNVTILPVFAGDNVVDINITVRERIYLVPLPFVKSEARNINVATIGRISYGVKFAENNLTGRNDKMNIFLSGGYSQSVSFNYTAPYLDQKLRQGVTFGFGYTRSHNVDFATDSNKTLSANEPNFARKTVKGNLGYTYRKGSHERHAVSLAYTYDQITDSVGKLNPNFFGGNNLTENFVDLSYDYQANYVDVRSYPLTGWLIDVSGFKRFSRNLGEWGIGGKYLQSWKILPTSPTYFMVQATGVARFPNNQPYYNSHLMGYGDLTMKGLELYVIDGSAGGYIRGTLRQKLFGFQFNTHLKSKTYNKIPFYFYAKTYSDVGYVYNKYPGNSLLNNKMLNTGGFGIDIVTIYDIAFKIEYSFNQLGGKGFFLHTSADF